MCLYFKTYLFLKHSSNIKEKPIIDMFLFYSLTPSYASMLTMSANNESVSTLLLFLFISCHLCIFCCSILFSICNIQSFLQPYSFILLSRWIQRFPPGHNFLLALNIITTLFLLYGAIFQKVLWELLRSLDVFTFDCVFLFLL